MDEENIAPDATEDVIPVEDGQAEDTEPTADAQEDTVTEEEPQDYDSQFSEFIAKKGWDAESAPAQLLKSYMELEGKLGNWKDVEDKASQYDTLFENLPNLEQKAAKYDEIMLERERAAAQLPEPDEIDFTTAPTETLAQLWKAGKIGLADLPPERQYSVQQAAAQADAAFERSVETKAKDLMTKYPILKDESITNLVADKIEKGIDPEEAVRQVQELVQATEKRTEERMRADMEKLKNANIETSSPSIATKSNKKVSSVYEAFQQAKDAQE